MTLLEKLKAQQAPPKQTHQTVEATANPTSATAPRPEIMPPAPPRTITRGRRRKEYVKGAYALDSVKSVALWANERLVAAPENTLYVGTGKHSYFTRTRAGARQRVTPYYEQITLRDDFIRYCAKKGWAVPAMKTFSGLILRWATEKGIPARYDRSHRQRRGVIKGIAIVDINTRWNGNEAIL